jgi:TolA-binding protein
VSKRRSSGAGLLLAVVATLAFAGCVMPGDAQQAQNDQELRGIVASDRQQINALQDQVARLNDQIAEMQHNDNGGNGSPSDKTQLAELQREVQQLKSGNAAPGAAPAEAGAPPGFGPGGPPNGSGPGGGPTGFGSPGGLVAPPPESGPGPSVAANPNSAPNSAMNAPAGASSAPGDAANANNAADADNDNSSDSDDNAPEVASNTPPPAAPTAPGPPLVSGSPSWRSMIGSEIGAAQSSGDPAAKTYRAGLINMKAGKYPQAVGVFQGMQRKYPKSSFSEPAEYFSANALYELGKYDQSILQFNDLVMRFPRGRFTSASLLSEAQAFMKLNDRIDARLTLQKLIGEHPDAAEAPTARAMMNSLANG